MTVCPKCGRQPRLVSIGCVAKGAWDGADLMLYVIRCRPFLGIFGTHLSTATKGVSTNDAWYRWKQDLIDEWNALADEDR